MARAPANLAPVSPLEAKRLAGVLLTQAAAALERSGLSEPLARKFLEEGTLSLVVKLSHNTYRVLLKHDALELT